VSVGRDHRRWAIEPFEFEIIEWDSPALLSTKAPTQIKAWCVEHQGRRTILASHRPGRGNVKCKEIVSVCKKAHDCPMIDGGSLSCFLPLCLWTDESITAFQQRRFFFARH